MSAREVKEELTRHLVAMNAAASAAQLWLERANTAVVERTGGRIDRLDLAGAVAAYAHAAQASVQLAEFHRGERDRMDQMAAEAKSWETLGKLL